jgi:nucleotide-binding universal stress UspA family protein
MSYINRTRVTAAFDDQHFSQGVMDYLIMLDRVQPISVTGLFLPKSESDDLWGYAESGLGRTPLMHPLTEQETKTRRENIGSFTAKLKEDIPCRIHTEFSDPAVSEMIIESRFSDLMVLGNEVFYEEGGQSKVKGHLRTTLVRSECPVMLVPEHFEFPGSNIIAYDGSEASVFAIKQYIYLFPEWCKNPTWLVYATSGDKELPYTTYVKELATAHFPDLNFSVLPEATRQYFTGWVNEKKGAVLVSGAFGRSVISENIRKSFLTEAIQEHKIPVFLAHR